MRAVEKTRREGTLTGLEERSTSRLIVSEELQERGGTQQSLRLLTRKRSQVQTLSRPPQDADQRKRFGLVLMFGHQSLSDYLTVWEAVCEVGIAVMVIGSLTSTFLDPLHSPW